MSSRFEGQWAFLSTPSNPGSRSLPPSSSYLRSDRSIVSPLPSALHFHQLNDSRSSLPRFVQLPSHGGRTSVTTIPSHPVLVRVHSADPILQVRPTSRPPKTRRPPKNGVMDLPAVEEFSFRGILAAIAEDTEDHIDAIAEILGRSRLVLADQHDSHLPPQGEIRASGGALQAVAEASSSNERLASLGDGVLILREDASLVEGSHTSSRAYGLLERLQTVPRTRRTRSEVAGSVGSRPVPESMRHNTDPAVLSVDEQLEDEPRSLPVVSSPQSPRRLLQLQDREHQVPEVPLKTTRAVVSETYLSAGANAVTVSDPPVVSEAGRLYPLYTYDYTELFEGHVAPDPPVQMNLRERLQSLVPRMEMASLMPWLYGQNTSVISAESQLREILYRQQSRDSGSTRPATDESSRMPETG